MQIQELKLLNFRNYERLSLSFCEHLNIIYGKNGSGKTNLVESIYVLALSRSFKQVSDKTLIRKDSNLTKVEGVINNKFKSSYKVIITNEGKSVKVDNNKITKISDYIGRINVVLFSPNDLKMIKDTPSVRRRYLNIALSQVYVDYLVNLGDYEKLIKLRNAYLKKMSINGFLVTSYLDVVTEKLIDVGIKIYESRKMFIETINEYISNIYEKIAGMKVLKVSYSSDFSNKSKDELVNLYKKLESRDISFGKTTFGVHHDDFSFKLNGMNLKDYGSEGQQKMAILSWKFGEMKVLESIIKDSPILILDDLLSELDMEKIKNILTYIDKNVQTFITTTEISKLEDVIDCDNCKKFKINDGVLEEG